MVSRALATAEDRQSCSTRPSTGTYHSYYGTGPRAHFLGIDFRGRTVDGRPAGSWRQSNCARAIAEINVRRMSVIL